MNHSPILRSASLTIISLLIYPAFTQASDDAPATPPDSAAVSVEVPIVDTPIVEAQVLEDETTEAQGESPAINMDRSGWPVIHISPADGSVTHHPHFMGDPPMGDDEINPLHAPDPVWQIQEALAGADAGNLNGENLAALGAQPFIGLAQFIALPVRMILDNPLSKATSP